MDIPKHLIRDAKILPRSIDRGGIMSNVDLKELTPQQRAQAELFEKNMHAMEESLANAGDGTNAFLGVGTGGPGVVSKRQMTMTQADVMKQRERGEPVIGIYYDEENDSWIVPDEYKMAWIAGYLCQHCLSWQAIPYHSMCNTIHGGSCCMPNPYAPELDGTSQRHNLDA